MAYGIGGLKDQLWVFYEMTAHIRCEGLRVRILENHMEKKA